MSKFIFAAFGIAVLALLMSLTYGALTKLFPNSFSNQLWGLVMFDIAAMSWALAFVFQSKSVGQYAASGLGFIVAFVGTLGMVAAEVMLSGQQLAQVDTSQIGKWMTYGFIVVTAIHALLLYTHHATAPDIAEQINVGVARGEITSVAIRQATVELETEKAALAASIHSGIVDQVKRDLNIPILANNTVFDRNARHTAPVESVQSPAPLVIASKKRPAANWLQNLKNKFKAAPGPVATYEQTVPQVKDDYGPEWENSTDISPTLDKYAWVCLNCEASHAAHIKTCSFCGKPRMNKSPVTAFPGNPPKSKTQDEAKPAPRVYTWREFLQMLDMPLEQASDFLLRNQPARTSFAVLLKGNKIPQDMDYSNFHELCNSIHLEAARLWQKPQEDKPATGAPFHGEGSQT